MGVAIGRFSVGPGERPATVEAPVAAAGDIRVAYQWVAAEHLGRVETFLTGFQVDARSGRPVSGAGTSAYELLSMTRVFLDSPSTEDVQLRALLEDIELVLAQIAHYGDQAPGVELDLIDESIEHRSVLFRLRTVMGAMPTGLTRQGVL